MMDHKSIDLVSAFENVFRIPKNERTTFYNGDAMRNELRSDSVVEAAKEIKAKALELLDSSEKSFAKNEYYNLENNIKTSLNQYVNKKYVELKDCREFKLLMQHMPVNQLNAVENVLRQYTDRLDLDFKRDENDEVIFDSLKLKADESYEAKGYEISVLKWYEGFIDSDDLMSDIDDYIGDKPVELVGGLKYEKLQVITLFNRPVLFTCARVKQEEVPKGFYKYDIRHDDDCQGDMIELKNHVMVNHWGTVICKEPFDISQEYEGKTYTTVEGVLINDEDYNYTGEELTIKEYENSYKKLLKECEQEVEQSAEEMGGISMG